MTQKVLNLKSVLPVCSLKEVALATIKEAILTNKLEPGIMHAESALANELGISRTPVREALIHLASHGLIVYFPRKGFQIRSLTERDVKNIFELRLALELAVIRRITPELTEASAAQIEANWQDYRRAMQRGRADESIHANRSFHLCLAYLTKNDYLIGALEDIYDLIDLASVRSLEEITRAQEAVAEHEGIISELKRKCLSGALKRMEAHIRITEAKILSRIKERAKD